MADTLTTKEKAEEIAAWTEFLNRAYADPGVDENGQLVYRTSEDREPRTIPHGPGKNCREGEGLVDVDLTFLEAKQCMADLAVLAAELAEEIK